MIRRTGDLKGFTIGATDGEIGEIQDVYFDDARWVVRYLIVDTGQWLPGRKVLISPLAVAKAEWERKRIDVQLTQQQVKDSPDIDTDMPVSRQYEEAYLTYYGYPYYWGGPDLAVPAIPLETPPVAPAPAEGQAQLRGDSHLRSTNEVTSYRIEATDGTVGHVEEFLFDDQTWAVRYIVVDTRNWWPGKRVLIAPEWIDQVSWPDHKVYVHVTRGAVKESPPYDPAVPLATDYETNLYRHYGRPFGS